MPDGYVRRQVAEKGMFQLRQQLLTASPAYEQKLDELMRSGLAYQQQHLELAERMMRLERENKQHRQREGSLRGELGAAQVLAERRRNGIILEERSAMHEAEERSAR